MKLSLQQAHGHNACFKETWWCVFFWATQDARKLCQGPVRKADLILFTNYETSHK